jgi:sugar phosphate isomerase/epimerase
MKLAISNIAWYPKQIDSFIQFISDLGCDGVELAASMIWDEPVLSSPVERRAVQKKISDAGLQCTGIHALLFTHPEMVLFGSQNVRLSMADYLTKMMDVCSDLGGDVLIYGSPKNRMKGYLPDEKAHKIALDFFREMDIQAKKRGVIFCLEPLAKNETDFLNSLTEAEMYIYEAGSGGLGLNIDMSALKDTSEYQDGRLSSFFDRANHVHINDPGLMPPGSTGLDHTFLSSSLRNSKYSKFISIEMRRIDNDVEGSVRKAIDYVRTMYPVSRHNG